MGGSTSHPLKTQIVGLLHAVQYLKPIVIIANGITIIFELVLGGSWNTREKRLKRRLTQFQFDALHSKYCWKIFQVIKNIVDDKNHVSIKVEKVAYNYSLIKIDCTNMVVIIPLIRELKKERNPNRFNTTSTNECLFLLLFLLLAATAAAAAEQSYKCIIYLELPLFLVLSVFVSLLLLFHHHLLVYCGSSVTPTLDVSSFSCCHLCLLLLQLY